MSDTRSSHNNLPVLTSDRNPVTIFELDPNPGIDDLVVIKVVVERPPVAYLGRVGSEVGENTGWKVAVEAGKAGPAQQKRSFSNKSLSLIMAGERESRLARRGVGVLNGQQQRLTPSAVRGNIRAPPF